MIEQHHGDRLDEDVAALAEQLAELGAIDVYVLPPRLGARSCIDAREKAFWVAKANGANDIIDVVVPRASVPEYHGDRSRELAQTNTARGSRAAGTPATATCTSRCSSPTPRCGTR